MSRRSKYEEKIRIRARKAQRLGLPLGTTYPIIWEKERCDEEKNAQEVEAEQSS